MSGYLLNLAEFSIASLFHLLALIRIGLIFRYKMKAQKEIAPFLMALLLNWTLVCVLILPYEVYGIAVWRPIDVLYHNGQVLFFIALPAHLFLAMIPVSLFFLTLDRILIIRYAYNYGQIAKKKLIYAYLAILLLCFVVCLSGFLSALPVPRATACEIYGCILGSAVDVYLGWRAFCSIFNFGSGIAFFVLLYKSSKKLAVQQQAFAASVNHSQWKKQQNKNNKMTMLAIIIEFFLAFLPHFGPFLWEKIFGPGSSMGTGPLSEIMSSFEVIIFASVYSKVLKTSGQTSSILLSGQSPSRVNMNQPTQIHPNHRQSTFGRQVYPMPKSPRTTQSQPPNIIGQIQVQTSSY